MPGFLKLNLQFFAAETGGEGGTGEGGTDWVDSYLSKTEKEIQEKEVMIPKKRFDDINNRYKALDDDYKNRKVEYDDMAKKVAASEQSYKDLETSVAAKDERVAALEGILGNMLNAELEQIDEEYRELVPADKPIEQQLEWLAKAKAKGLFASKGIEFEIGGMSNPKSGGNGKGQKAYSNMSPLEMMQMGYSNK